MSWLSDVKFDDYLTKLRELRSPYLEIQAAINCRERLRTAYVIAHDLFDREPTSIEVMSVFAELGAESRWQSSLNKNPVE